MKVGGARELCVCQRQRGKETETEREKERLGTNKTYKTHTSFHLTWEKVKAHDSYKHICYQIVHVLSFDALN